MLVYIKEEMNMRKLANFFFGLPDRFGGEAIRKKSAVLYFLWRELFHMAGGGAVGLAAYAVGLFSPTARIFSYAAMGGILWFVILAAEVQDGYQKQPKYKTLADLFFWFIGFVLVLTLTQ